MKDFNLGNWMLISASMLVLLFAGCTATTPTTTTTNPTTTIMVTTTIPATTLPATTTTVRTTTTTRLTTTTNPNLGILTAQSNLGEILTDNSGMTLYVFKNDGNSVSNCYGQCAQIWPPMIAVNSMPVAPEVSADVSEINRNDNIRQATFRGMPLYHYSGDAKAGDTKGEGVGGLWSAARVDVTTATTTTTKTTTTTIQSSGGYSYGY